MSTSLLHHGFGIRGYEAGRVTFTLRQERGDLRCAACGSRRVVRRGFQSRCFRSLPIDSRPVQIALDVPRVGCIDCGEVRQVPVDLADERRTYTHVFERHVLELSHHMTIRDVAEHLGSIGTWSRASRSVLSVAGSAGSGNNPVGRPPNGSSTIGFAEPKPPASAS